MLTTDRRAKDMDYSRSFLVKPSKKIDLDDIDVDCKPADFDRDEAEAKFKILTDKLRDLQNLMYAEDKRSLLVVLQGRDAAGKDGTIRHVFGPMNPQGCRVTSFKVPSSIEAAHDFLWRCHIAAPARGMVGIFNRSHYEDVLVVRVHKLVAKSVWSRRYRQINDFEKLLADNGTHIVKLFLHISKKEQKKRLQARIDTPHKHWKLDEADFEERKYWDDYIEAYETALGKCSKPWAPWYVIPADKKWYRNYVVSQILVDTLETLNMKFPDTTADISKLKID